MKIEVTTDRNVDGTEALIGQVSAEVDSSLARFADRLTRVEVHLGDENAGKGGANDKRCMVEVRPTGQQPVTATNHADTVEEALRGALRKIESVLDTHFGRLDDRDGGASVRHPD